MSGGYSEVSVECHVSICLMQTACLVFYFSKTALEDVIELKCKRREAERRLVIVLVAQVRI